MASMGKTKKLKKKRDWKHFIPYYLMGLPMVIYLFINNYMPLYLSLIHIWYTPSSERSGGSTFRTFSSTNAGV